MNVLVIGGAGFIGSHTVDRLIEEGFNVTILDVLQKPVHLKGKPSYINKKAKFILGINDKHTLRSAMQDVNYIFNFAAYQDYLPFFRFFQTNCYGNSLIYEIAVEENLPIKKVIVASSQFVNGEGLYSNNSGKMFSPNLRDESNLKIGLWDFMMREQSCWEDT